MKTQLFPKELIVSDSNLWKYKHYAQRLYESHQAFESIGGAEVKLQQLNSQRCEGISSSQTWLHFQP